jgi:hypothetical protein
LSSINHKILYIYDGDATVQAACLSPSKSLSCDHSGNFAWVNSTFRRTCNNERLNHDRGNRLNVKVTAIQDTLLAFCGKSLMRAQYRSDFHQIFNKCSPVHAKYGKVVNLTNNEII